MGEPEETDTNALKDAAEHLESAARCLEEAEPSGGNLDLVARTHICSATALVEMLIHHQEESTKARVAAAAAGRSG